jgi:formylglycine-generating enzyme required for sulfatase activity/serine/threonine protein kinase
MSETPPSPETSRGQSLPVGTHLEEFVIERVLGVGGFGITYLAKDSSLGRKVVIKENLPAQFCWRDTHALTVRPRHTEGEDADNFSYSLESFRKEASTLASLDHPGIVKVLRSFEANGTAYFVMPFVEGIALDEVVRQRTSQNNPFTEAEIQDLLTKVLEALGYLHERGIYHRDIKPGNILITKDGPVLIDFGAARQRLSERSLTVIESPGYTPFEQLQSRGKIGPWSDLYALGTTLHKAITGQTPAKATDRAFNDPEVPMAQRDDLRERYSPALLGSIDKAMSPKASDRFQDTDEWRQWVAGDSAAIVQEAETQTTPTVAQRAQPTAPSLPPAQESRRVSMHEEHRRILAAADNAINCNNATLASYLFKQLENKRFPDLDYGPLKNYVVKRNQRTLYLVVGAVILILILGGLIFGVCIMKEMSGSEERHVQAEAAQIAQEVAGAVEAERLAKEKADADEQQKQMAAQLERKRLLKEAEMKQQSAANDFNTAQIGDTRMVDLGSGVKLTLCYCPAGSFTMGSPASEAGRSGDEDQVQVRISRSYWLAKTECTQAQWRAVMGSEPSSFKGDNLPAESVSWEEAQEFMAKLNSKNLLPAGWKWSLPSEAQWEYACRAGTTSVFSPGDSLTSHQANFDGNYPFGSVAKGPYLEKTSSVGKYSANAWGLLDMHGNVSEWCSDWFSQNLSGGTDPTGSSPRFGPVLRGGSWLYGGQACRTADRDWYPPAARGKDLGFRAAAVLAGQ